MRFRLVCLLLAALLALNGSGIASGGKSAEEVRRRYQALGKPPEGTAYLEIPSVQNPYSQGSVREDALQDAANFLNFLRWLAGLQPVALEENLTSIAQSGAVLLAANNSISHTPEKPEDMPEDFYGKALYAASSSNLAKLNWMREGILRDALQSFAADTGEGNLAVLGHRRWLLNPEMGYTGLGLASSREGMSFVTMYAHDLRGEPGKWTHVAWPAEGAFPAELMEEGMAWSVTLRPEVEIGEVSITLTELSAGRSWRFPGDGFFALDRGKYGAGPCLIFRPEGEMDYRQNQVFEVQIEGLASPLQYTVKMISLYPIEVVSLEVSSSQIALAPGQSLSLEATVIPDWADDTRVGWQSSDPSVACVDETGKVAALAPGECQIIATAKGGAQDFCRVVVN